MKAVLFDFDGLILDTETAIYECWRQTYEDHGLTLSLEMWAANIGGCGYDDFHPFHSLEKGYGQPKDWDAVHEARRARYHAQVHTLECMSGVREAIAAARHEGLKTGVASSSDRAWVHGHLTRLGLLDLFDAIACGDEAGAIKPDPAVYHLALRKLGVCASRAFTFEDSAKGVAAAQAAGIYCIAVANPVTKVLDLDHADRRLASLCAVPFAQLLAEIRGGLARAV